MMKQTKIEEILSNANEAVNESREVRSLYTQELMNENPLFQTLSGIAGNIGVNVKAIASTIGGHVKGFAMGVLSTIRAMFPDIMSSLMKEWSVTQAAYDRAQAAGVVEGLLAAPCAWWITDLAQANLDVDDAYVIIEMYDTGKGSEEWNQLNKILTGRLQESVDKTVTASIISEWLPINEQLAGYQDKQLPNWLLIAVEKYTAEWQAFLDMENLDYENVARLIVSTQLKGRDQKDDPLLDAIFSEDPTDKQKSFREKLESNIEKIFDSIVGIHANLVASGKENGIRSKVSVRKFSTRLSLLYPEGKKSIEFWRANYKKEEKELYDIESFIDFLKKERGDEPESEEEAESKIYTDMTSRELCLKMFADTSWYAQVDAKIGADQEKRINQLVQTAQTSLGNELAKAQSLERLGDLAGASPEIRKSFEGFTKADPELKQYIDYATENNDEEIGSRLIAMFRPVFTTGFIDFLKKDFDFGGPKLLTLISQAESSGYKKDQDPMWKRWEDLTKSKKDELISGFEKGLSTLESQSKTAEKEIGQIMKSKAEEAEESSPEVDVEV